jgi:hypothetical protein
MSLLKLVINGAGLSERLGTGPKAAQKDRLKAQLLDNQRAKNIVRP